MRSAQYLLLVTVFAAFVAGGAAKSGADEMSEAVAKAATILNLLNERKFGIVWDSHVSSYLKAKAVKDQFIANMTLGRWSLGGLSASTHIGTEFSTQDPNFDYTGSLYAITFLNTYGIGKFYERLVIVLDKDGELRLGGITGAPASN